jgi:hypothetical protein
MHVTFTYDRLCGLWSEFLSTDPEVRVLFLALPDFLRSSGPVTGSTQPRVFIVHKINEALEHKAYCSAAFLDISQVFDKVWHIGLLYKLRESLPINYFLLLQSFLQNRHFCVRFGSAQHPLSPIHAGVSQGSVLGPFL